MAAKALIVEDDSITGYVLSESLKQCGLEPIVLTQGKPAVRWVQEHFPEVVLLDVMLPDSNGYDICEQLKLDPHTNLIPVIMVTALDRDEDRIHGLRVGADHYLTKPFTQQALRDALDEVRRKRAELERSGTAGEVRFHMESDRQQLEELNHLLAALSLFSGLPPAQIHQLTTAVRELGTNAIEWGHRCQVDRIVTATYRIDQEKLVITIRDTGPGFNPAQLPHAAQKQDPTSHLMVRQSLGIRDGGFGIMMARGLVDHLQYNETGNEVTLTKKLPSPRRLPDKF